MIRRAPALVALVFVACLAPVSGLQDGTDAKVVGRLVGFDGVPAAHGRVFLLDSDGRTAATTDADEAGVFELDTQSGRWSYAALSKEGLAAKGTWTLQAGGTTDVGTLFLLSSAEVPGLVDLRGLGLEEQRSSLADGVLWTTMPTARGVLVGSSQGVLRVPRDGGEPVLLDSTPWPLVGVRRYTSDRLLFESDPGRCWATTWAGSFKDGFFPSSTSVEFVLYDLERDRALLRESLVPGATMLVAGGCDDRGATVVLARAGDLVAVWYARGSDTPTQVTLAALEPGQYLPWAEVQEGGVVVDSSILWRPGDAAPRTLAKPGSAIGFTADGKAYLDYDRQNSALVDLESGVRREVFRCPEPDACGLQWDAPRSTLWAWTEPEAGWAEAVLWRTDVGLATTQVVELPKDVRTRFAACPRFMCPPILARGDLLLASHSRQGEESTGLVYSVSRGTTWEFPWTEATQYSEPRISPSGTLSVHLTGIGSDTPLFSAAPGQPLRRRTFMPAYRQGLAFDEQGLWYVRQDPRTSRAQLFFLEDDGG